MSNFDLKPWIISFLFASFIFFWGISLYLIIEPNLFWITLNDPFSHLISGKFTASKDAVVYKINFRYFILTLLIPIFLKVLNFYKNYNFKLFISKVWNDYKTVINFAIFLMIHYLLISFSYDLQLRLYNIFSIIFFSLIFLIYFEYRNFVINNLDKIIFIFISALALSLTIGFFVEIRHLAIGACSQSIISFLENYTNLSFSKINNIIFQENSHLAMMLPGVILYLIYRIFQDLKYLLPLTFLLFVSPFFFYYNIFSWFNFIWYACEFLCI